MTAISKVKHSHFTIYITTLIKEAGMENKENLLLEEINLLEEIYKKYCEQINGIHHLINAYEHLQRRVRMHAKLITQQIKK